ncbi:hypothetical protein L0F63_002326 [Massospora cicadina]|nr:hypothetical protein L0F63_002326 [Massospora cicadina]
MATRIILYNDPDVPGCLTPDQVDALVPKFRLGSPVTVYPADSGRLGEMVQRVVEEGWSEKCLLLTFHAEYFPPQAWKAMLGFLQRGHHFMGLGGVPFTKPISMRDTEACYQYLEELGIPLVHDVDVHLFDDEHHGYCLSPDTWALFLPEQLQLLVGEDEIDRHKFYGVDPKLSDLDEVAGESGSSGTLDRTLTPLVHLRRGQACLACAAWMLDHAGGAVQRLILLATQSVPWFLVCPSLACFLPTEAPSFTVSVRTHQPLRLTFSFGKTLDIPCTPQLQRFEVTLDEPFGPGLHCADVLYTAGDGLTLRQIIGFWVWDDALVSARSQDKLQAAGQRMTVAGTPTVIFGTTYMDSRIQRHYLSLPNPARWDVDLAEMAKSGVNLIRTGLWWGWGAVGGREWFRALDAFLLTCLRNRVQVQFTFFAFTPHAYRGDHPWLDPRALQGQSDLLAAVALRYAKVAPLSFDLINEPSFGEPQTIFAPRPIPSSERETSMFRRWQYERTKGDLALLNARWRTAFSSWEEVCPPSSADLAINPNSTAAGNGFKAMDYTLFSYDAFNEWVGRMKGSIRGAGSEGLVGVGQDEGRVRLPPQFHTGTDFTSTHPWWLLDHLLWDLVMDGVAGIPHLAQEVGVMLTRSDTRLAFRSQAGAAALLERKLFVALAVGCAGVIQWLWHTNGYMTLDNENSIGLVRVDGSAKPELKAFLEVGKFVAALQPHLPLEGASPRLVALAPYSQWALRTSLGEVPTRNLVRALGYHPKLRIIPQIINELRALNFTQTLSPHAILVPSLHHLSIGAWEAIDHWVTLGAHLLVTGVVGLDPYGLPYSSTPKVLSSLLAMLPHLGSSNARVPHFTSPFGVLFDELAINYVYRQHTQLAVIPSPPKGGGTIIWCGLPLEMAAQFVRMGSNCSCLGDFYAWALDRFQFRLPTHLQVELVNPKGMDAGLLVRQIESDPKVVCVIFVSELGCDAHLTLQLQEPGAGAPASVRLKLKAQRSGSILLPRLDTKPLPCLAGWSLTPSFIPN